MLDGNVAVFLVVFMKPDEAQRRIFFSQNGRLWIVSIQVLAEPFSSYFSLLFSAQNAYAQNNNIHPVKLRLRGELWSLWCGLIDIAAILLAETELLSNNVCQT